MESPDDGALLRQYVENQSDEAFAELVTRHINLVYSVAVRQAGNPQQAEEITQAVFIILAKKAATLRHDRALSSWLFQATHLTAMNSVRSERRRRRREQEAYMQSVLDESGNETWERIAPRLDAAVAGLNEKDRRAIVLRFYEGRNLREVGLALGANEETAKKRVRRAVEKLQQYFWKRGVMTTAEAIAGAIPAHSVQAAPAALAKTVAAVAMAKGVVTSTSTLTLAKGALKIMVWTKAKAAIIAVSGLILVTGVSVVVIEKESLIQGKTESQWIRSIVYFGDDNQAKLWRSFGSKGVRMLVRALKSPDYDHSTRMCVASLLSQLGNGAKSASPEIINQLKIEKDDSVRAIELGYFEGFIENLSEKDKAALFPELLRAMQSNDSGVRNNALVALQYYPDRKAIVIPLMVDAMKDSSSQVRMMAVKALNRIDPQNTAQSDFVPVLVGCLTSPPDATAVNESVILLGELHREPDLAVPALIRSLQNQSSAVRANSASALGRFGAQAKPAVAALTTALKDPDSDVRRQATSALERINFNAPPK
jgi:RNA polymerase sigma factor (sigma-70 family)